MKPRHTKSLSALAASTLFLAWSVTSASAATLTWDTSSGDGATVTAGSGNWNTTSGNAVWNNAGTNEIWSQTAVNDASNAAVFAGTDGTAGQYVVTIASGTTVAAESLTFSNSGYEITGGTLALRPAASGANGGITVAANKTATINSAIDYNYNTTATNTINAGATLNLGGGAVNSQYTFNGAGTVNITGGSYEGNVGAINVGNFNISGGTYNLTPGASNGYNFGNAVARNVNVNVSGTGSLTLNNTDTNTAAAAPFIAIGNNTNNTAYTTSLTVQSGGTVTIGGTQGGRAAEIRISNSGNANGLLDVQGGTLKVNTGNANNKIYLFKNGASAGYTANMTQSGGTVTTNGIQFGGTTGTYDAASSSNLTLSGGSLYIGAAGITKGSGATSLPTTITLQGGTLGADQAWSSSLNMQLGTSGGGVTIRTADEAGTGRGITLSGNLTDVSGVSGSLTKTGGADLILSGTNTYSGGTTINAGRVFVNSSAALPSTGSVTVNGGTLALNSTGTPTYSQNITLNSGSNLSMRKAATLSNVTLATSGIITFNQDDASTVAFTLNSATALSGELTVQVGGGPTAPGAVTLSGILSGSGNLVKIGSGQLSLGGNNTFNGLTIKNGTVNAITNNNALGAGGVTLGGVGSSGATLLTGRTLANSITVNAPDSGSVVIGANGAGSGYTLSGGIVLNGNLTLQTFDNTISGATKAGGTFTGGITGTGNVVLNNHGLAANTLTFNTGTINHTGSLTLQGSATGDTAINASIGSNVTSVTQNSATSRLLLAGSNSYTGATNVNAGTLVVNGNISTSSLTTVADGAIIGGSGTVGALTVADGGTLAPGNSPGTLSTGTLTLSGSSNLNFELNPTDTTVGSDINDLISVTGDLTLDGLLTVVATSGDFLSATVGTSWRLFNYTGTLIDNGLTLSSLPALSNDYFWEIDTDTAGQVNLVVGGTVIPEPGAALLGGLGLLALLRRRRD